MQDISQCARIHTHTHRTSVYISTSYICLFVNNYFQKIICNAISTSLLINVLAAISGENKSHVSLNPVHIFGQNEFVRDK